MNGLQRAELTLAHEAAEWLDKLEEQGSQAHAAFAEWITASPLHIKAFLNVKSVDRLLDGIDPDKSVDVDRLIAGAEPVVVPLRESAISAVPAGVNVAVPRIRWSFAAAAAVLLALVSWWSAPYLRATQSYAATPGEQRTFELADGTVVDLNTGSQISLRFSSGAREVFLDGEATFKVRKDPNRPFRVHSGHAVIQAVGTQFNVHGRPSGTIVSVLEGIVQITPASAESAAASRRLTAGEEALIGREGRIEQRTLARTVGLPAWRQHRLVFEDDRLDDIAAEFNRWNREQIRVEGAELSARLYSGAFNANDPESLIAFLRKDPQIALRQRGNVLVIQPK